MAGMGWRGLGRVPFPHQPSILLFLEGHLTEEAFAGTDSSAGGGFGTPARGGGLQHPALGGRAQPGALPVMSPGRPFGLVLFTSFRLHVLFVHIFFKMHFMHVYKLHIVVCIEHKNDIIDRMRGHVGRRWPMLFSGSVAASALVSLAAQNHLLHAT